jgi:hypothetical protein
VEWHRQAQLRRPSADSGDDPNFVTSALAKIGWETKPLQRLLSIINYFILTRNCIVHRGGRVSDALGAMADGSELDKAYRGWPTATGRKRPRLPHLNVEDPIHLLPRHTGACLEASHAIAQHMNDRLVEEIGIDGLVAMAAHHGLLSRSPTKVVAKHSADRVVNQILVEHYRVQDFDPVEVLSILKGTGTWTK